MLPQLSQCCCGCSLQTGTILIGAYQMVRGLFEIVTEVIRGLPGLSHAKGWYYLWDGMPFAEIALGSLKVIAAVLLLFGANKERHRMIFWWLIVIVALIIIDVASFPLTAVLYFMYSSTAEAVICLLLGIADLVLEVYFMWVVYCYYRIIEERVPPRTVVTA